MKKANEFTSMGEKSTSKKLEKSLNTLSYFESIALNFPRHCAVLTKKFICHYRPILQLRSLLLICHFKRVRSHQLRFVHPLSFLMHNIDQLLLAGQIVRSLLTDTV